MSSAKQRPSVLVTDARERLQNARRPPQRQDTGPDRGLPNRGPPGGSRMPMRFMTVDNVLQYNSQIPSGQPRAPPISNPVRPSTSAGVSAHARRAAIGGLPNAPSRTGQSMPSRTTKISEKLVLLPETSTDEDDAEEEVESEATLAMRLRDEEGRPLRDEELDVLRKRGGVRGKSYAERLPRNQRTEKVSRLTAYCTAQAFKVKATAEFLRKTHEAKTKIYDDCLYVIYSLPLLNGIDGYRVRSRPILRTPGTGKTILDLEIERSELRDHHEGFFEDDAFAGSESPGRGHSMPPQYSDISPEERYHRQQDERNASPLNRLAPEAKNYAEMFVYSYGVVVFWNFTEGQEKDILADLTFADAEDNIHLLTRPLEQADYETEEFHFEYSADAKRPRVFNDMITLMPRSDHMIKLTISHAIAQSTKLCFFEERMSETMQDAQHVPKTLALTGELNMTRIEIVKILGRLFKSRVDINLSSNILDVPNFFWDSEPTLHPLYNAIREYLEIDPRIKVLNERCRVFLDLAEILSDSVADSKMSAITWIIIILIIISILVTTTEVSLRFAMLEKSGKSDGGGVKQAISWSSLSLPSSPPSGVEDVVIASSSQAVSPSSQAMSDLEILASTLGLTGNATMENIKAEIQQLQQRSTGSPHVASSAGVVANYDAHVGDDNDEFSTQGKDGKGI